ncbi:neuronal membrane glycoprotein M6-a-like [Amphiura filiformis]|uniref:neuronal membrane glycoprotein M6-a-like n=1 Tax=Amphiura filiformis TaxID=82378 RepID=UPI003B22188C
MTRSRASSRASTISVLEDDPHGCCAKCCLRFPWPSIVAFIMLLVGTVCFLSSVHVGADRAKLYIQGTDLDSTLRDWLDAITITTYCVVGLMFVIAIMLLAVGCLATGSTRSSYMCRFRTRKSGRCQTNVFLVINYVLYLCWFVATCLSMVPLIFFHAMKKGVCRGFDTEESPVCLDFRQWGLLPYDNLESRSRICGQNLEAVCEDSLLPYDNLESRSRICGQNLEAVCEDSALRYLYFLVLASAMLIVIALVQFLINTSANHSQIRDRYKRTHVSRNAGAYNFRSSERESLSAAQRKLKKHAGRTNMPVKAALNGSQSIHGSMHGSLHGSNQWIDRPSPHTYGPDPTTSSFGLDPLDTLERASDSQEMNSISGLHQASSREPVYYHEYQI